MGKEAAIFSTHSVTIPSFMDLERAQEIKFGTGLEFKFSEEVSSDTPFSNVVLPCVFGSQLKGPVLLATGTVPVNVPFLNAAALRDYYAKLKDVVFIVDERMTDNARNLAPSWRINATFIVQVTSTKEINNADDMLELLNGLNINMVTALAGPQSLILIQISDKYYFYRGIANSNILDTSALEFGADVTSTVLSTDMKSMLDPRIRRIINLDDTNTILMPTSGQWVKPEDLSTMLEKLSIDKIEELKDDISAAVPQLQMLLNQKAIQDLSKTLIAVLSAKVENVTSPLKDSYVDFLKNQHDAADPESVKKKNRMLGELRKAGKAAQTAVGSLIAGLGSMVSTQTTSKRAHDLKRLARQAQIASNVEAAKSMTFDDLAGYLETYAEEMGVLLLNIESQPYRRLLGTLKNGTIDAR